MKENKSSIIIDKNPDKPSKLALCIFLMIFVLGGFLEYMLVMIIINDFGWLKTTYKGSIIVSTVVSIFIMIIGAGGILIYFIAPEKFNAYVNSVARCRLIRK
ncbi:MAG: hypothetical protein ACXAEX_09960 [Promethearchaeota archaeon]|jgi:hypothetical protein